MSGQLPGGKIWESRTARSWPFFPLSELLSRPSATSRLGKKARNILKATACETIPHCGIIRAIVRNTFGANDLSTIARDYIRASQPVDLHWLVILHAVEPVASKS